MINYFNKEASKNIDGSFVLYPSKDIVDKILLYNATTGNIITTTVTPIKDIKSITAVVVNTYLSNAINQLTANNDYSLSPIYLAAELLPKDKEFTKNTVEYGLAVINGK